MREENSEGPGRNDGGGRYHRENGGMWLEWFGVRLDLVLRVLLGFVRIELDRDCFGCGGFFVVGWFWFWIWIWITACFFGALCLCLCLCFSFFAWLSMGTVSVSVCQKYRLVR